MTEEQLNREGEVTHLLQAWSRGDANALGEVFSHVYQELRGLAHHYGKSERRDVQATALVNEIFIELEGGKPILFNDRKHFFRMAAKMMRRLLVVYARKRLSEKRGGGRVETALSEDLDLESPGSDLDTLFTVEKALEKLEKKYPEEGQVVAFRVFMGMNNEEIGKVMGVSPTTVKRLWSRAKQRLFFHISGNRSDSA